MRVRRLRSFGLRYAMVRRWLFKLARSRFSGFFIGNAFAYLSWAMPVERHFSNSDVVIFSHPTPFWHKHWLVVPKRGVRTLLDLQDPQVSKALFRAIQRVTAEWPTFMVLVNWGAYQDVPQVHFHLAVGQSLVGTKWGDEVFVPLNGLEQGVVLGEHPRPGWEHHLQLAHTNLPNLRHLDLTSLAGQAGLVELINLAQTYIQQNPRPGYRLLSNIGPKQAGEPLTFHLVSGKKLSG